MTVMFSEGNSPPYRFDGSEPGLETAKETTNLLGRYAQQSNSIAKQYDTTVPPTVSSIINQAQSLLGQPEAYNELAFRAATSYRGEDAAKKELRENIKIGAFVLNLLGPIVEVVPRSEMGGNAISAMGAGLDTLDAAMELASSDEKSPDKRARDERQAYAAGLVLSGSVQQLFPDPYSQVMGLFQVLSGTAIQIEDEWNHPTPRKLPDPQRTSDNEKVVRAIESSKLPRDIASFAGTILRATHVPVIAQWGTAIQVAGTLVPFTNEYLIQRQELAPFDPEKVPQLTPLERQANHTRTQWSTILAERNRQLRNEELARADKARREDEYLLQKQQEYWRLQKVEELAWAEKKRREGEFAAQRALDDAQRALDDAQLENAAYKHFEETALSRDLDDKHATSASAELAEPEQIYQLFRYSPTYGKRKVTRSTWWGEDQTLVKGSPSPVPNTPAPFSSQPDGRADAMAVLTEDPKPLTLAEAEMDLRLSYGNR